MQYINANLTGPGNTTFHVTAPPADSLLIMAVEEGLPDEVTLALKSGANPNARKRVVLGCTIWEGSKTIKKLFGKGQEEQGMGPCETKFCDILGESALALAILHDSKEIIELLLDAGANPNASISWKLARSRAVWTTTTWRWTIQEGNWDIQYTFTSAVELALGSAQVVDMKGNPLVPVQDMAGRGNLWVNKPGGVVQLLNPSGKGSTFSELTMIPNTEIVELLIARGARPTVGARQAILSLLSDTNRLEKLEKARMSRISRGSGSTISRSSSLTWSMSSGSTASAGSPTSATSGGGGTPTTPASSGTGTGSRASSISGWRSFLDTLDP
ncbi:hypothetical protein M427DRAFT_59670 [Gonapodya prolifera JEL478]|uniref:Uncharacterized protein n=1 Tax=Gonapodya prolifera (strain JEL478) TaxID=1344416 RepID=A0A139A6B6_GONPJ|nr:hypothetical protein M427DRAFT_59670 [Gonapodya prolifera JEL478]|eukprot:KXS12346.1 hypothetical protein M427DRAFT_59670 [Gonapodya prolifera JEL478]